PPPCPPRNRTNAGRSARSRPVAHLTWSVNSHAGPLLRHALRATSRSAAQTNENTSHSIALSPRTFLLVLLPRRHTTAPSHGRMNRLPTASAVRVRALVPGVPRHAVWPARVCDGFRQNGTYRLASMRVSERDRFGGRG